MILFLLACSGNEIDDSFGGCRGSPAVSIVSPIEGTEVTYGERVSLEAVGTSTVDEPLVYLWGVAGDVVAVGQEGAWVADTTGSVEITLQAEDSCGNTQTSVRVEVIGDSG